MTNPLDLKFDRFLTLWLVKAVWGISLVLGALTLIVSIIYGLAQNELTFALWTPPPIVIGSLLILRIWLELVMVLFRIADNTSVIAQRPGLTSSIAEAMPQRSVG
jgi:Domain of unknown function (DUF4282)